MSSFKKISLKIQTVHNNNKKWKNIKNYIGVKYY